MEEAISSRDIFAIYEKENPVVPEEPKQPEKLFEIEEEPAKAPKQAPVIPQAVSLPEEFEENLVNKITNAILEKLKPTEGGE